MNVVDEYATARTRVTVRKYSAEATARAAAILGRNPSDDDFAALGIDPEDTVVIEHPANRLVTVGLAALTARLHNTGPEKPVWSASATGSGALGMGIGNGTQADAIGDSDLVGGSKAYKQLDNGYPTVSNGTVTDKCTFGPGEAEFAWEEYGRIVPNTGASAMTGAAVATKPANMIMFNRKAPAALGTKGPNLTWSWEYSIVWQ